VNGESIYGSKAFDLPGDMHDWGRITCKTTDDGKTKVYLHVYNWPLKKQITVTGIKQAPEKVYLLADKLESPLKFDFKEVVTNIDLSVPQPDPFVSVVVMEFDNKPEVETGLAAKSVYGGYSLTPYNFHESQGSRLRVKPKEFGSIPAHFIVDEKSEYVWKIYVDKPCEMSIDVSYGFEGESKSGKITVNAAGQTLKQDVENTGLFVIEPGQDSRLENYKSFRFGKVRFDKAGYYDIKVNVAPPKGKEVHLQWLWLEGDD
jgi:alpha-L-fucosidase